MTMTESTLVVEHRRRVLQLLLRGGGVIFMMFSFQATLRYNVPLPKKASGFSLSVEMEESNSSDVFQTKFNLTVTLV